VEARPRAAWRRSYIVDADKEWQAIMEYLKILPKKNDKRVSLADDRHAS
jgi:hypothetical protein